MSTLPDLPPKPIPFEGDGRRMAFARVIAYRPPKAGEYYLSGARVAAYLALNNFLSSYWIVRPLPAAAIAHEPHAPVTRDELTMAQLRRDVMCNLGDLDALNDADAREVLANLCKRILDTDTPSEDDSCVPY